MTRAFLQLVRLIRAHRTRLPASLRYLKEQMDAVNAKKKKHEPQARSFQTTTYYKMVKNQAGILDRISPEAFAALRKYLGKFDLDGDAATTSPPSPQLLSLQVDALRFFRASADEVAATRPMDQHRLHRRHQVRRCRRHVLISPRHPAARERDDQLRRRPQSNPV